MCAKVLRWEHDRATQGLARRPVWEKMRKKVVEHKVREVRGT